MKKLVLVLVFSILMIIFFTFNYLLWEKEQSTVDIKSLKSSNEYNEEIIETLGRELRELRNLSKELEGSNKDLKTKNDRLAKEQLELKDSVNRKSKVIDQFKYRADLRPLENTIRTWADNINKGNYTAAYNLEFNQVNSIGNSVSSKEYGEIMGNTVKNIKVRSIKLGNSNSGDMVKGDMLFMVTLDVNLMEGSISDKYKEGLNDMIFALVFDIEENRWRISDIKDSKK